MLNEAEQAEQDEEGFGASVAGAVDADDRDEGDRFDSHLKRVHAEKRRDTKCRIAVRSSRVRTLSLTSEQRGRETARETL